MSEYHLNRVLYEKAREHKMPDGIGPVRVLRQAVEHASSRLSSRRVRDEPHPAPSPWRERVTPRRRPHSAGEKRGVSQRSPGPRQAYPAHGVAAQCSPGCFA